MVVTLSLGTALWLTIDPTHQLFEGVDTPRAAPLATVPGPVS
jgi:hypothetical protein